MLTRKNILPVILLFAVLTILIVMGTYYYILKKQTNLLNSIYNTTHLNIVNITESLIQDKLNTTLTIALSLAKNLELQKQLKEKNYEHLDYAQIIEEIKEYSKYKNVWIQILDSKGSSKYRSWTKKRGDNLLFRDDLQTTLAIQKISTSISVGLFSLTLKARTPVYDENKNFLGVLEIITHFNSITEDLKQNNIYSVVATDKRYKEVITFPFTNLFVDDYYIANSNVNVNLLEYLKKNEIEKYINISSYIIENGYLISKYVLYYKDNEKLAYILNFKKLEDIDTQRVESFKTQIIMVSIIGFIILFFSFLIFLYSKYLKELKIEENKKQTILDSQSNIITITNGKMIVNANKKLYEFFTDVKNFQEFKDKHRCICTHFIDLHRKDYIIEKDYDGKTWAEFVLTNENDNFRVAMRNEHDELRHFSIKASKSNLDDNIIATFSDITQEINKMEEDKDKDRLLFQQSKISAIADTIKNIAHQWRQPLSVISTIASGMKIQKQMNILSDEEFNSSCNSIINNTQKLSDTIENFTNFFDKNNNISNFSFVEATKEILNFLDSIFEKNNIKYEFIYDKDTVLQCNKNDFSQAFLNILDNSVFALIKNKDEKDRLILIEFKDNILEIKDNANGIDELILPKILEPYFTTKHQAFGVGLGLYLVQEFFVKTLGFKIDIKNVTFEHKNKEYLGTNFIIYFN